MLSFVLQLSDFFNPVPKYLDSTILLTWFGESYIQCIDWYCVYLEFKSTRLKRGLQQTPYRKILLEAVFSKCSAQTFECFETFRGRKTFSFYFYRRFETVTGRFANVSVRQRPVRQRMKSICQLQMSVRQRLYVSSPTSKILLEIDLKCIYKLPDEDNVTFDPR